MAEPIDTVDPLGLTVMEQVQAKIKLSEMHVRDFAWTVTGRGMPAGNKVGFYQHNHG